MIAEFKAELKRRKNSGKPASRETVEEHPTSAGTLRLERVRCGKKNCRKCADGPAHGPYWYLYRRRNGRMTSKYVGKFGTREEAADRASEIIAAT